MKYYKSNNCKSILRYNTETKKIEFFEKHLCKNKWLTYYGTTAFGLKEISEKEAFIELL